MASGSSLPIMVALAVAHSESSPVPGSPHDRPSLARRPRSGLDRVSHPFYARPSVQGGTHMDGEVEGVRIIRMTTLSPDRCPSRRGPE
jgi:hypothetical protein